MQRNDNTSLFLDGFKGIIPIISIIIPMICGLIMIFTKLAVIENKLEGMPTIVQQVKDHESRITKLETIIEVKKE